MKEQRCITARSISKLRHPLFAVLLLTAALGALYLHTRADTVSVSESTTDAPSCPIGLAGRFTTGWSDGQPTLQWYRFLGERTLGASDTVILSFAVVPFDSGDTLVALDEVDGRTGFQLVFSGGLVNSVVPYNAGSWNTVKAEFDFGTHTYRITVNGITSAPIPFDFGDADSVQALRVHSFGASAETSAWYDSISVLWEGSDTTVSLLHTTFDDGAVYSGSPGTVTSLEPPAGYALPEVCTSAIQLQVSPTVLEFTAVEGGSNPEAQSLFIGCTGTEPLSWEATESVSWLDLSPISATHPTTAFVTVDVDGLSPGVHTGEIVVSSDAAEIGSPQTVYVSLAVRPASVEPSSACPEGLAMPIPEQWYEYFGEHTLAPTDTLILAFSIVPGSLGHTEVDMDEAGGRTGYNLYFFDGVVYGTNHGNDFRDDMPLATYDRNAWNTVQADYYYETHSYTLTVNGVVTGPIAFTFPDSSSVQAVRSHTSVSATAWLDSLSIVRKSDEAVLYASDFDDESLPGTYPLPQTCVPLSGTLHITPPTLAFTVTENGSAPAVQAISITHSSSDPLSWTAGESLEWASLSSISGTTPTTVELHVDAAGLAPGTYSGPVTLYAARAENGPQQVDVHLQVEPDPRVPIQLAAEPGLSSVRLHWNPTNDPAVTRYRISRAIEGSGSFAVTASISDTTYLDADPALEVGASYCYYVEALRSEGQVAAQSNTVCATFGRVELWIPDTWAAHGQTRIVPVNIRNATGLQMAASDIWIDYDGTVIELLEVSEAALTAGYTWSYAITSTETYSRAHISYLSMSPPTLYGEGSLFWLTWRVLGSQTQESPLDLVEFAEGIGGTTIYVPDNLLDPIPLHLQDGVFHVADGCVLGDLNGNGVVEAVDAYIALKIATGELVPTVEQLLAGDINGDAAVDAADATMIHYYATNGHWPTPAPTTTALEAQNGDPVIISLDGVSGAPGDTVQTVLRGRNLLNWAGGKVLIAYDADIVDEVVQIEPAGLASGFAVESRDSEDGLLHIALASSTAQSGDGALVIITLRVSPAAPGGPVPLSLVDVALNDLAGRDFVTSALQHTILRQHGALVFGRHTFLPVVHK